MHKPLRKDPVEVANRLDELLTSREMMLEVIEAVAAARAECTDNDPFGARGWRGWQMGTRRLRELHVGVGDWAKDDADQVPSIVSERAGVRIVVCNTDDGTSIETRRPQNSSKKGASTERAVDHNQMSLFDLLPDSDASVVRFRKDDAPRIRGMLTYYLCVHAEGDERRAELSCPRSFEGGFFGEDFYERILILGGDAGPTDAVRRKSDDDDGEFDIPVTRKN